jgi:hypothetical protein
MHKLFFLGKIFHKQRKCHVCVYKLTSRSHTSPRPNRQQATPKKIVIIRSDRAGYLVIEFPGQQCPNTSTQFAYSPRPEIKLKIPPLWSSSASGTDFHYLLYIWKMDFPPPYFVYSSQPNKVLYVCLFVSVSLSLSVGVCSLSKQENLCIECLTNMHFICIIG